MLSWFRLFRNSFCTGLSCCIFIFCITIFTVSSYGQLTDDDIAALKIQGEEEGWTFEITKNPATEYSLDELCGVVEPSDWREKGRFVSFENKSDKDIPAAFDWREIGGCTSIKNQGGCGSCWAFSTVGALECNILIQDGTEVDLSEQFLVSCNYNGWDCAGGWFAHDYHKLRPDPCDSIGATLEEYFPYQARDLACGCPYPKPYQIEDWAYIGSQYYMPSVSSMKLAIMEYGPISVCVAANGAMQSYGGGIFNGCDEEHEINHAVVIVGWDDNQASDGIWIMRNSWGTGWGEGGYMRMPYGCSRIGYAANYVDYAGGVAFEADTLAAWVPFDVGFSAISGFEVIDWNWDYGDGDMGVGQNSIHNYDIAGTYDVTCQINTTDGVKSKTKYNYIMALADTMIVGSGFCPCGYSTEVPIQVTNNVPVRYMKIPIEYGGDCNLTVDSISTHGCRTEFFDNVSITHSDSYGKKMTVVLSNTISSSSSYLPVGTGDVLKVYFKINVGASYGQSNSVIVDGYSSNKPLLSWPLLDWTPKTTDGSVSVLADRGDVDGTYGVFVSDLTFMVNYIFKGGAAPIPQETGDVNCDYNVNVADLSYLVNFLFKGGSEPDPCF